MFSKGISFKDCAGYLKTTANTVSNVTKRFREGDKLLYGEITFDAFVNEQFKVSFDSSNNKNDIIKMGSKLNKFVKSGGTFQKIIENGYYQKLNAYSF